MWQRQTDKYGRKSTTVGQQMKKRGCAYCRFKSLRSTPFTNQRLGPIWWFLIDFLIFQYRLYFSAVGHIRTLKQHWEHIARKLQPASSNLICHRRWHYADPIHQNYHADGNDISLIDSREGVINQLVRILDQYKIRNRSVNSSTGHLYVTGGTYSRDDYTEFARRYGLEFKGEL